MCFKYILQPLGPTHTHFYFNENCMNENITCTIYSSKFNEQSRWFGKKQERVCLPKDSLVGITHTFDKLLKISDWENDFGTT